MVIQPKWSTRNVNEYFYEREAWRIAALNSTRYLKASGSRGSRQMDVQARPLCSLVADIRRCGLGCGRNADAGMACRVGRMYGEKPTFSYPKSNDSGSKAAGIAAPSVGRNSSRQSAKAAFDGRNGCQKCFCVTFDESNKAYAPYPALITRQMGERILIEANDQLYDREGFCQP